jgi:serine/threonine protein kinase
MKAGHLSTPQGGVHITRIVTVLRQVACGMSHLHRLHLTHGDLDPSQILLQIDGFSECDLRLSNEGVWLPEVDLAAAMLDRGRCTAKLSNFGWSTIVSDVGENVNSSPSGSGMATVATSSAWIEASLKTWIFLYCLFMHARPHVHHYQLTLMIWDQSRGAEE